MQILFELQQSWNLDVLKVQQHQYCQCYVCLAVNQPLDLLAVGCESSLVHRLLCYGASYSTRHIHHSATTSHLTASLVTDKHGSASVFIEDKFSSLFTGISNCSPKIPVVSTSFYQSYSHTHFQKVYSSYCRIY